jgi:uncharacterized repeat protein (TIGR01451 family)
VALAAALGVLSYTPPPAQAATTNRYATDDHGNFLIFGNTAGFDCRDGKVEKPVVGTVPVGVLGLFSCNGVLPDNDSGVDILWRSQYPGTNQATAGNEISPDLERTTAILALPTGAQVVMARLYWAAQRNGGQGAGTTVNFDRPGGFSRVVQADAAAAHVLTSNGLDYYQSSADVTRDLQVNGNGAYRIGDIQTIDIRAVNLDVAFIAWNIVVFYHLDSEPIRNLTLFDGLEHVSTAGGSTTTVNLNGFTVPNNGYDAKLGVIAYEGDADITGDSLKVNGNLLSNTYNPPDNFFNRTATSLNNLMPMTGDLPQMSGRPSSMAGYDADIVDISGQLTPGSTQVRIDATTTGDEYFLGVFAVGVSTVRPVFSSTFKTVVNLTRTDGRFLPGDTLEYTISTTNTGNDVARQVTLTDALPAGITYAPGSLVIKSGANAGNKTDQAGDDQAEYSAANRTVTFRLGNGATANMGGDMAVNESATVVFHATIDANAMGTIVNQAVVSAVGKTAMMQGANTPVTWPSGNGGGVNVGTPVTISTCMTNADCPVSAPICDTTLTPPQCVCKTNTDCQGGRVCNTTTHQCVECLPLGGGTCDPNGTGGLCLPNDQCGCATNSDCNGRVCNTTTQTCAPVNTDLSVTLTRTPAGPLVAPGTALTYTLTVANNSQAAVNDATLSATLAPALSGATWTCMGQGGAQCPQASGTTPIGGLVNLPAGGKLVYTIMVTSPADPATSTLDFTGSITPPRGFVDSNPADNVATDSVIIGTPPTGPDLSVTVTETPSTTDNSVDYTIQVTNHGPGAAAGATVTYNVPPGAMVQIMPGDGWNCDRSQDGSQVACVRTKPIDVGDATPIVLHVTGPQGATSIPLHVTVGATDGTGSPLTDPNPADNTVDRVTPLAEFRLAGGGLGSCDCSLIGGAPKAPGASTFALAGLCGLALLLRARRRSERARATLN